MPGLTFENNQEARHLSDRGKLHGLSPNNLKNSGATVHKLCVKRGGFYQKNAR